MMPVEPITLAVITSFIIGLTLGAVVTGLAPPLMERPRHWITCLRLPEALYDRLKAAADTDMVSLKAEIISRLQASF
jgi:hypothetical protein